MSIGGTRRMNEWKAVAGGWGENSLMALARSGGKGEKIGTQNF